MAVTHPSIPTMGFCLIQMENRVTGTRKWVREIQSRVRRMENPIPRMQNRVVQMQRRVAGMECWMRGMLRCLFRMELSLAATHRRLCRRLSQFAASNTGQCLDAPVNIPS